MNTIPSSLIFTGDISFDRYMSGRFSDPGLLSEEVLSFLHSGDHVIANVEGALAEAKDTGSHGIFFHCMDPEATEVLKKIHADIWNISNNHIMDAGKEGLESTLRLAQDLNCKTIGAGLNEQEASRPVYLPEAGGIGIFGVAYMTECIPAGENTPGVFRWDNMELISKRIQEIKKTCRWCIIVSHGGEEFADLPNPYTRERYLKFLELGADIVVAHHPHVPENYEITEPGKAIFYSLGNFIFDTDYQRVHPYTDEGVLLKLCLTEKDMKFEAIGTKVLRGEERIIQSHIPAIFENVPSQEYELLAPLSASAFLQEERAKMIYLEPDVYRNAAEENWNSYFFGTSPDGYDKGAHMDLSLIVPLAAREKEKKWKESTLEEVKNYILRKQTQSL